MQEHHKIVAALQVVAKDALRLAGKFHSPDMARITHEAYNEPRKNNATRTEVQQEVCDIRSAVDQVVHELEQAGFKDVLARYNQ